MYNSVLEEFDAPSRVMEKRIGWTEGDAQRDASLKEADDVIKYTDLSYGPYGDWNLLDVYIPSEKSAYYKEDGEYPLIIDIHGGGYFYGDKGLYRIYCMELAHKGFAVVNFNYRLAPENHFPATIEDIYAVFEWVSKNAKQYRLDVDRVFMTGDSAGAQLVSQFAAIWTNPEYADLYGIKKNNINILAVSLACGMYDIITRAQSVLDKETMEDYLGVGFDLKDPRIDVLNYINGNYPDTYLFSAENDFLKTEAEPMYRLLKSRGVECEMDIYGTPEATEVAHVFHINIAHPEAVKCNNKQESFFKSRLM